MKMMLRALIVCGTVAALAPSASAADRVRFYFSTGSPRYTNSNHAAHMRDLQYRRLDRQIIHHNAHHYPMTRQQHGRLHNNLRHEALHDRLEHRQAHRSGAYSYPYSSRYYYNSYLYSNGYNPYRSRYGIGYSTPGFSIRLGR